MEKKEGGSNIIFLKIMRLLGRISSGEKGRGRKKIKIKIKIMGAWKKWPDKSTTSYAMLDFESDIENFLSEISGT